MDARQLPLAPTYHQSGLFRKNRSEALEEEAILVQHHSPIRKGATCCLSRCTTFPKTPATIYNNSNREFPNYKEAVFPNQQHLPFDSSPQTTSELGLTFFGDETESSEIHNVTNPIYGSHQSIHSIQDINPSNGTYIDQFPKYDTETNNRTFRETEILASPSKETLSTMSDSNVVLINEISHDDTEKDYRYNPFITRGNKTSSRSLEDMPYSNLRIPEDFLQYPLKNEIYFQTKSPANTKGFSFDKTPNRIPLFDSALTCPSSVHHPPSSEIGEHDPKQLQIHSQAESDCLHAFNLSNSMVNYVATPHRPILDSDCCADASNEISHLSIVDCAATSHGPIVDNDCCADPPSGQDDLNEQTNIQAKADSDREDSNSTGEIVHQQRVDKENADQGKDSSTECVKPALSYIALIATAILESSQQRLSLGSIYSWIETNYPYYKNRSQGWRNSVRHNLSLNDCFVKAGRCEDGKGNYWAIHPANVQDFMRGDFRQRRRSRRRGRKSNHCDINIYPGGYLAGPSSLSVTPQALSTLAPALNPIYSPYTEAERQAYRLDEALLRQTMNSPFVKWYHGPIPSASFSTNANDFKASGTQWQTYPDNPVHQMGTFSK